MTNEKTIHFDGLNALRFFSALSILIYHSTLKYHDGFPPSVKMMFHNLHLGVDMFFIISGFLIVYLLLQEKEKSHTISLYRFYLRRILRIFPLYFLILGIAWFEYHTRHPEIAFHRYLYFTGNFWMIEINAWTVGILNPLWSLCIEEHFYLVIPLLIFLIPLRKIHLLFWSIIILSLVFRAYATLSLDYNWFTIYAHTLSRCDVLALGGLLAYYHKAGRFNFKIPMPVMGGVLFFLVLLMSVLDNSDYTNLTFAVFKKYLFILPMLFLFAGFILNQGEDHLLIHGLKSNRIIDYLGKISFGLYMYHSPVSDLWTPIHLINDSLFLRLFFVTLTTMIIATVSYELLEKQILKLKTKFEIVKKEA
jgi:peptidoglycan/LPS O-acetylase OafA/YrhL